MDAGKAPHAKILFPLHQMLQVHTVFSPEICEVLKIAVSSLNKGHGFDELRACAVSDGKLSIYNMTTAATDGPTSEK